MEVPTIKVTRLNTSAAIARANPTDSGLDVSFNNLKKFYRNTGSNSEYMYEEEAQLQKVMFGSVLTLSYLERALIGTGLKATVGVGYEIQVRPRSGLALKQGLTVLNTPGTIDEAYRDEICVLIVNLSRKEQRIKIGDRIAQLVVAPVVLSEVEVIDTLGGNDRMGGFGSTGLGKGQTNFPPPQNPLED